MFTRITRTVLLASMGAAAALAAPASAESLKFNSEVRYGDLNLTTDKGVAQLHQRIKAAARQACGYADGRDIRATQAVSACRQAALAQAAPKIDLAIANARNGEALAANAAVEVGKPGNR